MYFLYRLGPNPKGSHGLTWFLYGAVMDYETADTCYEQLKNYYGFAKIVEVPGLSFSQLDVHSPLVFTETKAIAENMEDAYLNALINGAPGSCGCELTEEEIFSSLIEAKLRAKDDKEQYPTEEEES